MTQQLTQKQNKLKLIRNNRPEEVYLPKNNACNNNKEKRYTKDTSTILCLN